MQILKWYHENVTNDNSEERRYDSVYRSVCMFVSGRRQETVVICGIKTKSLVSLFFPAADSEKHLYLSAGTGDVSWSVLMKCAPSCSWN